MEVHPPIIRALMEQLKKLPGIGEKSAERLVDHFLKSDETELLMFAENLQKLKKSIRLCARCCNISESEICHICEDNGRERILAIVEESKDLIAMEKAGFRGYYHVLGGHINPLERMGPENLSIGHLIKRLDNEQFNEIILATNATPEGETTAVYLADSLKRHGIQVSRLATGMPVGGELEYSDPETLRKSIEHRHNL